jgi:hypothetical protein
VVFIVVITSGLQPARDLLFLSIATTASAAHDLAGASLLPFLLAELTMCSATKAPAPVVEHFNMA